MMRAQKPAGDEVCEASESEAKRLGAGFAVVAPAEEAAEGGGKAVGVL